MLFNIHTLAWDDELLRLFGVPRSMLPEVRSSSEVYGRVSAGLGLADLPIAGIAGDQQAALFGQMCVTPGMAKNTYGTGCFLLQNTGTAPVPSTNQLVTTVAWQVDGRTEYALEGSVFIGGAVVQWLRDGLGLIQRSSDVEAPGHQRARQRRRLPGPGVCRPRRAALGSVCPRHDDRHHARHDRRPHRAGRGRKHRLPGRPTCSRPCRATPASRSASCGSTAAPPATTC